MMEMFNELPQFARTLLTVTGILVLWFALGAGLDKAIRRLFGRDNGD
jgi:hypothetical protein